MGHSASLFSGEKRFEQHEGEKSDHAQLQDSMKRAKALLDKGHHPPSGPSPGQLLDAARLAETETPEAAITAKADGFSDIQGYDGASVWSEAFDEEGNAYYQNSATGETSWNKPSEYG